MLRNITISTFAFAIAVTAAGCRANYPTPPSGPIPIVALRVEARESGVTVVGSSVSLFAYVIDSDDGYTRVFPTWSSSNASVVRVGAFNLLQAVAPGTVVITGVYQGFTDSATITVRAN